MRAWSQDLTEKGRSLLGGLVGSREGGREVDQKGAFLDGWGVVGLSVGGWERGVAAGWVRGRGKCETFGRECGSELFPLTQRAAEAAPVARLPLDASRVAFLHNTR